MKDLSGSIVLRLLVIGFLILLLLIPAGMISSLVGERQKRKEEAVAEVTGKWAEAQTLGGPVVTIPYEHALKDDKGKTTAMETAYISVLPRTLQVNAEIEPEIRYRGIYKTVLYHAKVSCQGSFSFADLEALGIAPADIHWQDAFVSLGLTDMRGIREYVTLAWNGTPLRFTPGIMAGNGLFDSGVSVRLPPATVQGGDAENTFAYALDLNGSRELGILPLGQTTTVKIASPWRDPSFSGAFLPEKREISEKGFIASWRVLDLNRNYPQLWLDGVGGEDVSASKFSVALFTPVDEYTKTSRAIKYALMFLGLTFLVFFLVEVFNRKRIHPIQYLLVGLALCLFYLLLLSLAEHLGFVAAYILASLATIILIAFYIASALGGKAPAALTAALLAILYGFLYILLQNQDYALLLGSIGLFAIMAAVMYLSRGIDWYAVEAKRRAKTVADSAPPTAGDPGPPAG